MKRLLISTLLLSLASTVFAQRQGGPRPYAERPAICSVSGTVSDSISGQAVEFAAISLILAQNDSLITGGITNEKGTFLIESVRPGRYKVRMDFMGYNSRTVKDVRLSPRQPITNLGALQLAPSSVALDAVEISAERNFATNSIDKKVYDVSKNAVSDGGSATDVLQNVPSIDVDIDGNVSLRGSENVTILIDGKPSALTGSSRQAILEQLPASSIERIEVITNPSARYDPDGMSGIINVVLKKNRAQGVNGSVRLNAGTGGKYNGALDLNYRTKKVNVFASYSGNRMQAWRLGESERTTTFDNDSSTFLRQDATNNQIRFSQVLKGGLDLFANQRNTISLSATFSPTSRTREGDVDYLIVDNNETTLLDYLRLTDENEPMMGNDFNVSWDKQFEQPNRSLSVSARYSFFERESDSHYDEVYFDTDGSVLIVDPVMQNTLTQTASDFYLVQADYVHPLNNGFQLETGYKSTLRETNSDFYSESWDANSDALMPDTLLNNEFVYTEDIHAIYGIVSGKIKELDFQAGVRAEQAFTKADQRTTNEVFNNDYANLFPSAHIAKKLPKEQEIRVSYSRRINRPHQHWLNPFSDFRDPLNIRSGNPNLLPEYINNYEVSYARRWKQGHSVTGALYYRPISNVIRRIRRVDENGVATINPENLTSGINTGLEAIFTAQMREWWNLTLSSNLFRTTFDGGNIENADGEFSNDAYTMSAKLNSMMTIKKDLQLQVSARYRAPSVHTQGEAFAMFNSDVALKWSFWSKKGALTLRVSDVSNTRRWKFTSIGPNYNQIGTFKRESRIAFLGFSYRFGKQQAPRKRGSRGRDSGGGGGEDMEG